MGEPVAVDTEGEETSADFGPTIIPDEDRHEYRAYLQRGETRLSTFHRVAALS